MRFFRSFPDVDYKFGEENISTPFTDLSRYADIIDQVKDDATVYQLYQINDGERPDIVSHKLYGNETYGWSFWLLNDNIKEQGWPLSYLDFREFLSIILPGDCLTINGISVHSKSGITVHALTEQFPIGSSVFGSQSGAMGTVYMRNLNLGQLFLTKTNDSDFIAGEVINNTNVGTPLYTAQITSASLAYNAAHHYLDSNGVQSDIDPTTGIVPAGYTEVTHEEFLQQENDDLSKIKVIRPSLISRFASLYKETINR